MELVVRPIGFVRSPWSEKAEAPRQSAVARDVAGTVEVLPAYRDALDDLDGFERVWLIFWFDRAHVSTDETGAGFRSKVLPPRSTGRRGVFATRSPHRPNPIGMSAVRLDRVDGLVLHVRDLDLVDGTPVLDIKPYLVYADAFPEANAGWLEEGDPCAAWDVVFEPAAEAALEWIEVHRHEPGEGLRARIAAALAVKEWRARFRVDQDERRIVVVSIGSGYRPRDLAEGQAPVHALHRAFVAR